VSALARDGENIVNQDIATTDTNLWLQGNQIKEYKK
jgi:hypothetical protein